MTRLLTTDEVSQITGIPETLAQWRWLKKEIPFVRLSVGGGERMGHLGGPE